MLANRFRAGSSVSATSWRLFQVEKPVADSIAAARHVVIVLAGSRQVRCVSDVLARWTFKKRQDVRLCSTLLWYSIYSFCVM